MKGWPLASNGFAFSLCWGTVNSLSHVKYVFALFLCKMKWERAKMARSSVTYEESSKAPQSQLSDGLFLVTK